MSANTYNIIILKDDEVHDKFTGTLREMYRELEACEALYPDSEFAFQFAEEEQSKPKHAKPMIFAGDVRRGTVLLTEEGKPMLVTDFDFYESVANIILRTRVMGVNEVESRKVSLSAELPLASISTAEFLLWEFSGYAVMESMLHDRRYRGQLAE